MLGDAKRKLWLKLCPHDRWSEIQDAPATLVATGRDGDGVELVLSTTFYRCLGCGKETGDRPDEVYCVEPFEGLASLPGGLDIDLGWR